jgi:DNA-binding response OmpR family regulator
MWNILIVDDDPNIALLVEMALHHEPSYHLTTLGDSLEALEYINANPPDLLLLDIMMPGIDGYEVCRRLKQDDLTKHIPIIMVTAKSEMDDKIKGMGLGASDFITKPFNPEELSARVAAQLRIRELEREVSKKAELGSALKTTITLQHEINNPLTGIIGNLEYLTEPEDLSMEEIAKTADETLKLALRIRDVMIKMGSLSKVISTPYFDSANMIDLHQSSRDE